VNFGLAILYRGAGIEAVWPEFLIVTGIGLVCFAVALMRFRRMIVLAGRV
jgi:ABC-2 type transport system permease protein